MKLPASLLRMDIGDVRQRLGDDDALIAVLFRMFLEDCAAQVTAIKTALDARQTDAVRRTAHMLKGSAGNLSAFGVTEAATALEDAAARGDVENLDRRFATLVVEVDQLVAELRGVTAGSE